MNDCTKKTASGFGKNFRGLAYLGGDCILVMIWNTATWQTQWEKLTCHWQRFVLSECFFSCTCLICITGRI